ncbi:MAG: ATP-binding protein [Epsilonproteobacteria bacterium]|nr:MAG: ATP-binding protein [Campylobacterota bacterium]
MSKKTPEELREELQEILQNEPNNFSKILELSNALSKFDKNVRFSVDAGIINRLGKELVGKRETAVAELVKNAYDADATTVDLYFTNTLDTGGLLKIDDNGVGMTREELVNGFMRLSSSGKIHNPISNKYSRERAGRKGIGRFSAQRLGTYLTIVTQAEKDNFALQIEINWEDFVSDIDLSTIAHKIVEVEKEKIHGTTLYIDNLRENWTDTVIKRVYRYVSESDLLQPFPLSKEMSNDSSDPGFKVNCYREDDDFEQEEVANDNIVLFQHALAEIDAYTNEDGYACYSVVSDKLNLEENNIVLKEKTYSELNNIRLKAYYYIYNKSLIPKKSETIIKDTANEFGGIRLYRNGFRVLPYAERDNDWLGLDASTARRSILPTHRNINYFGFIEIFDENGENFEEQSNREGLIENNAFIELQDFAYKVLTALAIKIGHVRGMKVTTNQEDWEHKKIKPSLDDVLKKLDLIDIKETSESKNSDEQQTAKENIKNIKEEIAKIIIDQEEEKNNLIDELNMLRVLAGLGLVIGEFVHEIKFFQASFHADIDSLIDILKDKELELAKSLKNSFLYLDTYRAYFDSAVSQNVNRELKAIELRDVVRVFIKAISQDYKKNGITFEKPIFNNYDIYTCEMHESEWASILFNFYSNSKKAIKRIGATGKILISAGIENNIVYLEFSDNGNGINTASKEKVFNAFYTTNEPSGRSANEHEEISGTGLGLKITKDIIASYNGNIYVANPKSGYATTIRIELPKATEKEIANVE